MILMPQTLEGEEDFQWETLAPVSSALVSETHPDVPLQSLRDRKTDGRSLDSPGRVAMG